MPLPLRTCRSPPPADVLLTDLPAPTPENEAAWVASQPGLRESLAAQLLQLKVQASQLTGLALATPEERRRVAAHKALTSDKLRPTRDAGARGCSPALEGHSSCLDSLAGRWPQQLASHAVLPPPSCSPH